MAQKNDDEEFRRFVDSLEKATSAEESKPIHLTRLTAELEAEKQRPVEISLWVVLLVIFILVMLPILSIGLFGYLGLLAAGMYCSGIILISPWLIAGLQALGKRGVVIKK